jgi:hypothetical protein
MSRDFGGVDPRAVQDEFQNTRLGDKRLERRVLEILPRIAAAPADSFPEQMASVAEREALYRFLSNPKVTMQGLLEGHVRATHERIRGRSLVRVVHDTSPFRFAGDREGLGVIRGETRGFFAHASLAIAADETREPLGVLALYPYARLDEETANRRELTNTQRQKQSLKKPREEKESSRWERQAKAVSDELPKGTLAIHLIDQEGDSYDLLGELLDADLHFVVRVDPHRKTKDNYGADEVLRKKPASIFRTVHLNPRPKHRHNTPTLPARRERTAHLEVRWDSVTLTRQRHNQCDRDELVVSAVHVTEPNPPAGEPAVEWMLFTTEPVSNLEEATAIVDHYRARWIIEEYFKALKTGCKLESRQLTSFDGLTRALALFVPIAWHLLVLRHLGREEPSRAATSVFDDEQLVLLRALLDKRRYKLPAAPTVRDVMLGIAALGGHIKNNGDPGWLVLGRGFTRFVEAEEIWRMARGRSDQS